MKPLFQRHGSRIAARLILAWLIGFPVSGNAAESDDRGYVEVGANRHNVTGGFEDWEGIYVKGVWRQDSSNVWNAELLRQSEFGDRGTYAAVGLTRDFDPDWYASVTVGTSDGGFFLPRLRIDAFVHRKWLPDRRLVSTLGVGYFDAKDVYRDRSVFAGLAYYFSEPWVVEGGVRLNESDPGSVRANSGFVAVTYGRAKSRYLVARAESGREAYQLVGEDRALVDFRSNVVSLSWREWVSPRGGFVLQLERYRNPSYDRNGVVAGIFRDF